MRYVKYHVDALHRHREGPASIYYVERKEGRMVAHNGKAHENTVPVIIEEPHPLSSRVCSFGASNFCFC